MNNSVTKVIKKYKSKIILVWDDLDYQKIENLALDIVNVWKNGFTIYICGNSGSATNANHIANDLIYGVNKTGRGIKIHSLCANDSILTCLANDTGYENIFSKQLKNTRKKE